MSTLQIDHLATPGTRRFRGRSLAELIPRIREELGADAIIVRQREGVLGGIGGFFTQRFVEVEARRGEQESFDMYDDMPDADLRPFPDTGDRDEEFADEFADEPAEPTPFIGGALQRDMFMQRLREAEWLGDLNPEDSLPPEPEPEPLPARSDRKHGRRRRASSRLTEAQRKPAPRPKSSRRKPAPAPRGKPASTKGIQLSLPPADELAQLRSSAPPLQLQQGPARPAAPHPGISRNDPRIAAGRQLSAALTACGASSSYALQVIASAQTHQVFGEDLASAARAEISRRILPAPPLPLTGAAIGFIGAGGSGKTSCTAALASAYASKGKLPVTVITVDSPDGGEALRRRLADEPIEVTAVTAKRAPRVIGEAKARGVVIVDTPSVSPTDSGAITALGLMLRSLGLSCAYVTLPATLAPAPALRLLSAFAPLRPAAAAITHLDEGGELAPAVQAASEQRLPLVFKHSGTDHKSALTAVDSQKLARELIP